MIGIIPLLLLSFFSYWQLTATMHTDYNRIGTAQVDALRLDVSSLLQKNMQGLKLIAAVPSIKTMDLAAAKQIFINTGKVSNDLSVISIIDKQGQQVVKNDNSKLVNVADRPFYQEVIKGKDDFISEVTISKSNGHPMVLLSTPIRSASGEIVGVLPAAIDLNVLSKFVSDRSQDGNTAYIVDKSGKVLAHPDEKLVSERTDLHELDYIKAALSGQNGTVEITAADGKKKIVSFAADPFTGWAICSEKSYDDYLAQVRKLISINVILLLITVGVIVIIGYYFSGRTVKPLLGLLTATNEVKNGNLVVAIEKGGQDEPGRLAENFSSMVDNLRQLIRKIAESAEYVAASSEELTASAEQSAKSSIQVSSSTELVSQNAAEQSALADNMNTTAGKMTGDIESALQGALLAAKASEKSAATANSGSEQIKTAICQMENIEQAVSDSSLVISELGNRSQEIGQIVSTITSIADQTNLLALNAAIEAARAGEAGRGFAVVAEEVRKLAEQSGVAASQVAELINSIQSDTTRAVATMQKGTAEVQTGAAVIKSTGDSFYAIVSLVHEVSAQVSASYELLKKVATSNQELHKAVLKIDTVSAKTSEQSQTIMAATQEQSASMEEISTASQTLARTAEELSTLINRFKYN
jgi:methyl-accepting chemotaxis protein